MTNEEVNNQYEPIDKMIESIPEKTVTGGDGVEYAGASSLIKVKLMLVVHHCKNMKLIDADFDAPFTKQDLDRLTSNPFNRAKLDEVEELRAKYAQLDEEAYQKGDAVA